VPLISPNVLKNKLLKRIKEHKQKETQNLENNKRNLNTNVDVNIPQKKTNIEDFTDEFTDSINYLQTLSKQKHIDQEKKNSELIKQKRREELERKTIKNYNSLNEQPTINIELPEELMQPVIHVQTEEPLKLNNPILKSDVPYGILKGGTKPSYRQWSKTFRNDIVTNPNASLVIEGNKINSEKISRENRLNLLKQKIKNKNQEENLDPIMTSNLIIKPPTENITLQNQLIESQPQENKQTNVITQNEYEKLIGTKHITKKTIKRKYTLGRSQIKKTVGVLIKDRGTRKKVLNAQKDLKRKNMNDIKVYLREHNLIKTGSNAPNDVLRKLYESAMLAGEITNSNTDTLLHNFSKDEKEL